MDRVCDSIHEVVGEVGLEPTKAKPADLQSAPFATRDIPPLAVEPHGISGKLQAPGLFGSGCPRAGVMVTPLRGVNRKRTRRLPRPVRGFPCPKRPLPPSAS